MTPKKFPNDVKKKRSQIKGFFAEFCQELTARDTLSIYPCLYPYCIYVRDRYFINLSVRKNVAYN